MSDPTIRIQLNALGVFQMAQDMAGLLVAYHPTTVEAETMNNIYAAVETGDLAKVRAALSGAIEQGISTPWWRGSAGDVIRYIDETEAA